MSHAFVTVAVNFNQARRKAVEDALDALGNPADRETVRDRLRGEGIHFISGLIAPGDGDADTLIIEFSADGGELESLDRLSTAFGDQLRTVLTAADAAPEGALAPFLANASLKTGQGLFDLPGLNFAGAPGMSVERILGEARLARAIRDYFDDHAPEETALATLAAAREEIAKNHPDLNGLMRPEPAPLLGGGRSGGLGLYARLAFDGALTFFWPLLTLALAAVGWSAWNSAASDAAGFWSTLAAGLLAATVAFGVAIAAFYGRLRALEASDAPDRSIPDQAVLQAVTDREDRDEGAQNHLAGVSLMKPGLMRKITLRMAFWIIGQLAQRQFPPGYLGEIGTIHFARWVMLPGGKKLVFLSNYGGSWESYLEDFITKASNGLTGVWSNTYGFPYTENLFFKGATNGDEFKRWARRQQQPTRFWYSAYPHLTTERIRRNASLRLGLTSAATEDEAAAWLSSLASARPPAPDVAPVIEKRDVQSLLFGGLSRHSHAACVLFRFADDPARAKALLANLRLDISFGDVVNPDFVEQLALSANGLSRLGVHEDDLKSFPLAFRQGMDHPTRQRILVDTGEDKPSAWTWGHGARAADGAFLVYARDETALAARLASLEALIDDGANVFIGRILMSAVEGGGVPVEPFGFADGVSQPVVLGARPLREAPSPLHAVSPGEFILGYPDNRGYRPLSPSVDAMRDPGNILPAAETAPPDAHYPSFEANRANAPRDFGRNGSYLVIRQMAQHVDMFEAYIREQAAALAGHPALPAGLDTPSRREEWIGAKMVGRWKDGTSLVRFPHRPGVKWSDGTPTEGGAPGPDNDFRFGAEDPSGRACPYGAHIRRANPRDSLEPGSEEQIAITNRHRILRRGRTYDAGIGEARADSDKGLLFMCLNGDIERQFEFIQQTWSMTRHFHGLDHEVDPILGRGGRMGRLTIPTSLGPIVLKDMKDFTSILGGGYFFLPGARALALLAQ